MTTGTVSQLLVFWRLIGTTTTHDDDIDLESKPVGHMREV